MAIVTFFGKTVCRGNLRQRAILEQSGHTVDFHDILAENWSEDSLKPFLEALPPAEWFNKSANRVKSGEVTPDNLSAEEAMALILEDHALLRRPLMKSGGVYQIGWNPEAIDQWIGLKKDIDHGSEACHHKE
ncbi:MAG: ArsC/Spx/MgsR family protein [Zymomonas mobilis]|uniref:Nitrogenase-associated protein n=1 Tax=Zymomonas mobilis TaxID=542 RepID=A0A542W3H4_ZYMMB|nr:ArsC/Spx/MgsR family protein [Zymomonas mobilis]TQL18127.1 nitrogenase-associated protein [Zymomonas mobilis]